MREKKTIASQIHSYIECRSHAHTCTHVHRYRPTIQSVRVSMDKNLVRAYVYITHRKSIGINPKIITEINEHHLKRIISAVANYG